MKYAQYNATDLMLYSIVVWSSRECIETILVDLSSVLLIVSMVHVLGVYVITHEQFQFFLSTNSAISTVRLYVTLAFDSSQAQWYSFAHKLNDYFGTNFTGEVNICSNVPKMGIIFHIFRILLQKKPY